MRRLTGDLLFCSILFLVIAGNARAEQQGMDLSREAVTELTEPWTEVTGSVVDAQGNPVSGARVVRLGPDSGETLTDESGAFRLILRHDGAAPVSLVFEKQSGSEKLHAVQQLDSLRDGERTELGVITLGGACEPHWTPDLFPGPPGTNATINALTVFDDGSGSGPALYAGGQFTTAEGGEANRIAKWDGSSWSALGSGMNNTVWALTVFDDGSGSGPALYAGGSFTFAGGISAPRIAKWDGSAWSALGTGMSGMGFPSVHALAAFDDGSGGGPALYAGGDFTTAGGGAANYIAKWDGSSWSALGTGTNNTVFSLATFDDGSEVGPAL